MNQDQNNHYTMYKGVSTLFSQNTSIWSGNSVVSGLVTKLNNNILSISNMDTTQLHDTTGATTDKAAARTLLITILVKNAAAGYGYAASISNNTLKEACHLTATGLGKLSAADLYSASGDLYNTLNPIIASLVGWGIAAADLTAQQSAANSFNGNIGLPITARAITHAATQSIPSLITTTSALLDDQLDAAMMQYKITSPAFYQQYKIARKLPAAGGAHHYGTIRCTALNAAGAVVAGTDFVIAGITRKKKKAKNGKGSYVRIHTPISVTVTATAPGMQPVSHTLHLNANGVYTLSFVLVASGASPAPGTGGTTTGGTASGA